MSEHHVIQKHPTLIPGFDLISMGGLPARRATLVTGTSGSGKTVLAGQLLAAAITQHDEAGVFVTLEETADEIRDNLIGFGWDVRAWEAAGKWAFVDASRRLDEGHIAVAGEYDLGALLARIDSAVRKVGARRVVCDSLGALFTRFRDSARIRDELWRITTAIKKLGVIVVITAERPAEHGQLSRHGIEEFIADNVIVLRNLLEGERRRRTIEIVKFRGTPHQKGQFPFTILPNRGIVILPLSALQLDQSASDSRVPTGITELDTMCSGGLFRASVTLVSGATGAGKTLLGTHFLAGGASRGERSLIFAFEESRSQLFRNAVNWGLDFPTMEQAGHLAVICAYPETSSLEDLLLTITDGIDEHKPNRVVVDSLSALERSASEKSFREFVISLTSLLKRRQITALFTADTPTFLGGETLTERHISTITDTIIALRYIEIYGHVRRCMTIIKMRGSDHDRRIREYEIDNTGLHVGAAIRNVTGILSGSPVYAAPDEMARIERMFVDPDGGPG